jgi:hypothetical protein
MRRLDIETIHALIPKARGRSERAFAIRGESAGGNHRTGRSKPLPSSDLAALSAGRQANGRRCRTTVLNPDHPLAGLS